MPCHLGSPGSIAHRHITILHWWWHVACDSFVTLKSHDCPQVFVCGRRHVHLGPQTNSWVCLCAALLQLHLEVAELRQCWVRCEGCVRKGMLARLLMCVTWSQPLPIITDIPPITHFHSVACYWPHHLGIPANSMCCFNNRAELIQVVERSVAHFDCMESILDVVRMVLQLAHCSTAAKDYEQYVGGDVRQG